MGNLQKRIDTLEQNVWTPPKRTCTNEELVARVNDWIARGGIEKARNGTCKYSPEILAILERVLRRKIMTTLMRRIEKLEEHPPAPRILTADPDLAGLTDEQVLALIPKEFTNIMGQMCYEDLDLFQEALSTHTLDTLREKLTPEGAKLLDQLDEWWSNHEHPDNAN